MFCQQHHCKSEGSKVGQQRTVLHMHGRWWKLCAGGGGRDDRKRTCDAHPPSRAARGENLCKGHVSSSSAECRHCNHSDQHHDQRDCDANARGHGCERGRCGANERRRRRERSCWRSRRSVRLTSDGDLCIRAGDLCRSIIRVLHHGQRASSKWSRDLRRRRCGHDWRGRRGHANACT